MKLKALGMVVLFSIFTTNKALGALGPKTIKATYVGVTSDGMYKFQSGDQKSWLFDELHYDIDIDLYSDEYSGKIFLITYEEDEIDEYDDEGDPTGEVLAILRIIKLEEETSD
ncbi:MAG: hypothetical protein JJ975_08055 [Bacteroidia bacterium]|nr:hypothetical protein [Bacteroidia bacterium]